MSATRASDAASFDRGNFTLWVNPLVPKAPRLVRMDELLVDPESESTAIRVNRLGGSISGLPVVDGEGRWVGMWQWTWGRGDAVDVPMVPASEILQLVQLAKERPIVSLEETVQGGVTRALTMPVIDHAKTKTASSKASALKDFSKWFECPKCDGDGTVDSSRADSVSGKAVGEPCVTCRPDHVKVADKETRWEKYRVLAAHVCEADPTEDRQKMAKNLENGLKLTLELNRHVMSHALIDGSREELEADKLTPGRSLPLWIPNAYWPDSKERMWGEEVRRIVGVPGYPPLLLRAPYERNTIDEGCGAFVAGVVAGRLRIGETDYVVLERTVVVPINSGLLPAGR